MGDDKSCFFDAEGRQRLRVTENHAEQDKGQQVEGYGNEVCVLHSVPAEPVDGVQEEQGCACNEHCKAKEKINEYDDGHRLRLLFWVYFSFMTISGNTAVL